jgi:hypothetical protein
VRGAVIETIANVSAEGVVTITPVPDSRWDNHEFGWHFDETSGTRASVGDGSTTMDLLVDTGTPGYASGKFSNAATLYDAGGTDQILRASSLDARFAGDWTAHGWIYLNSVLPASGALIGAEDDSSGQDFNWAASSGDLRFNIYDDAAGSQFATVISSPAAGSWYFISMVYTSSTKVARVGYNGANFTNLTALSGNFRKLSTSLYFQATVATTDYYVDEFHFFSETKTDAEIAEFYNSGSGRLYPYG